MAVPEPDAEADLGLMQRLQAGEDLALNELMGRWEKPLIAFIFRFIGNQEEAVDIAQETFVRVYTHKRSFDGRGKFSSWLFSIASNLCRNHLRWKSRHPTVILDAPDDEDGHTRNDLADKGSEPWENVHNNEMARLVKSAVSSLPDKLKAAVILCVYEELPYLEIARALNCTVKAVENRMRHARELLAEALKSVR